MPHRRFPPKLRVLASVPRWSIIPLIKHNDVASHTFYVSYYAHEIARLIGWDGPMDQLLWQAIIHDVEESITGDILGTVKRAIMDEAKTKEYMARVVKEKFPHINADGAPKTWGEDIKTIIKVADLLDALYFVCSEMVMGNSIIGERLVPCVNDLQIGWGKLPANPEILETTYKEIIGISIDEHLRPDRYSV